VIALSSPERAKLIGILGMLGSAHDGERAAAGLLATRMLRDRGITWSDLIGQPETSRRREDVPVGWCADLALCRRHLTALTAWESNFVASLARRSTVSVKQRSILADLADARRARGLS